ncbi:helix-turn-helix transcriptional regulator, partial [Brachyspira pilosicoli]
MNDKLLREKIRDLDLRISDLAEYLKISRPTLYKYIDMYEEGDRSTIDTKILNLFDYIQNSKNIGNSNVIYYIMNNILENSNTNNGEEDKRMKIKSLLKTENKSKEDFIYMLTEDNF